MPASEQAPSEKQSSAPTDRSEIAETCIGTGDAITRSLEWWLDQNNREIILKGEQR